MSCCGKILCSGCVYAPVYDNQGNVVAAKTCPFCRTPIAKSTNDALEREKKRVEKDDPIAIYNLGVYYDKGRNGFPQDYTKALELWHKAGELGYSDAYVCIGYAYDYGRGVEVDQKKATYYYDLAAIGGDVDARYNLGLYQAQTGNFERSIKHLMIAVRGGNDDSLNQIKRMYSNGHATKEDYTKGLQKYQAYLGEIKSAQRDEAAAADEDYRYY